MLPQNGRWCGEAYIALASRTLVPAEKNYSQLEKEALAIVYAVKKFHTYLYGRHFFIYSDHQPLSYLLNESKGVPAMAASRIQHWALTLSAYEYTIIYRPGKDQGHADALSRLPLPQTHTVVPVPGNLLLLLEHLDICIQSNTNSSKGSIQFNNTLIYFLETFAVNIICT